MYSLTPKNRDISQKTLEYLKICKNQKKISEKLCYPLSFAIKGGKSSTRSLQSNPFHNPGGGRVAWAWHTQEEAQDVTSRFLYRIVSKSSLSQISQSSISLVKHSTKRLKPLVLKNLANVFFSNIFEILLKRQKLPFVLSWFWDFLLLLNFQEQFQE